MKKSVNERTFQGRLFIIAEKIFGENKSIGFILFWEINK